MGIEIEGFEPQNPDFGPFWAGSELSDLPPKTSHSRSPEICIVPKCGFWREMGLFGMFMDHKVLETTVKESCLGEVHICLKKLA